MEMFKSHRLVAARKKRGAGGPNWPSFRGHALEAGTSPSGRVTVYYDQKLGASAAKNAKDLIADADRIMEFNDQVFGKKGDNVNVIIFALNGATDGTGGADHGACNFQAGKDIEVCASFGKSARVSALFEAELSECSMNNNLCGLSTGEALSRWCATEVSNNALADFATGPAWFNDGMPNFVDTTENTDQDEISTGCGMVFLSWLQGPTSATGLGQSFSLDQIAQAMVRLGDSGTLADLYAKLTRDDKKNAWKLFKTAVEGLGAVTSDDPFGAFTLAKKGSKKDKAKLI